MNYIGWEEMSEQATELICIQINLFIHINLRKFLMKWNEILHLMHAKPEILCIELKQMMEK